MKKGIVLNNVKRFCLLSTLIFYTCVPEISADKGDKIDKEGIAKAIDAIKSNKFGNVHSLLMYKDGELVVEEYFNEWSKDSLHMLQSATKSFISTLVGIAVKEGFIKNLDQKVVSFYNDLDIGIADSLKREITIKDLLTQKHGLLWNESQWNSPNNNWRKVLDYEGNWYEKILQTPMAIEPGTKFNYSNAAPVLLVGIIQEASGMPIDEFAKKFLFTPLEIKNFKFWQGNGGPSFNGSSLLFLTSVDMVKLGRLYLNKGKWGNKQILPENWVKIAAESASSINIKDNKFYEFGYGYLWWNMPKALGSNPNPNPNIYIARGAGGQYIIVDPKENTVVVITAWDMQRANYIFNIYTEYIQSSQFKNSVIKPKLVSRILLSEKVESSMTVASNGKELYFAQKDSFYTSNQKSTILYSKLIDGNWSVPQVASFSGVYSDSSPFITLDGNRIYFSSNRPLNNNSNKKDRDIWYVEKVGEDWSKPIHLAIYNSQKSEYSPSLDINNNLYFGSYRDGGYGSGDIWVSRFVDGKYQEPINMGNNINTSRGEWGSCVSNDGNYIIFEASGREENITYDGDLYISYKRDGIWSTAKHLGNINSGGSDLSPRIHNDTLYFASNRHDDPVYEYNNNNVEIYKVGLKCVVEN